MIFCKIFVPAITMANTKINNLKTKYCAINKIIREDRYDTEDLSQLEKAYILKHAPVIRKPRTDLCLGNLVVVLEGMYTGRRGIFLSQFTDNLAIVFIFTRSGNPIMFKIDEKFLLKLSSSIEVSFDNNMNTSMLYVSRIGEKEIMVFEENNFDNSTIKNIVEAISKVKFMKSYLIDDFKVDNSTEFYSQKY